MKSARYLLPESGGVFNQGRIVLVLSRSLLEWSLTRNHIEEDYADSKDVCFTRLMRQLKMDLGTHVVDRAYESL